MRLLVKTRVWETEGKKNLVLSLNKMSKKLMLTAINGNKTPDSRKIEISKIVTRLAL